LKGFNEKKHKVMRRGIFILTFTFLAINLIGQDTEREMVEFTPDFRFNDGIFLTFEQVKNNDPISKAKILTSADYNARDFFKQVFENDEIYFYDAMGIRQEVSKEDIWGYARNGILYVQMVKPAMSAGFRKALLFHCN